MVPETGLEPVRMISPTVFKTKEGLSRAIHLRPQLLPNQESISTHLPLSPPKSKHLAVTWLYWL